MSICDVSLFPNVFLVQLSTLRGAPLRSLLDLLFCLEAPLSAFMPATMCQVASCLTFLSFVLNTLAETEILVGHCCHVNISVLLSLIYLA